MDFEPEYSEKQQKFRNEVREWLKENMPKGLYRCIVPEDMNEAMYQKQRELGRKLGAKGWLRPLYPKEYGGGGLEPESALVIVEELDAYEMTLPPYYDTGNIFGAACIYVWGTEEQKKAFLPPICKGEVRGWQALTEPEAGSDLANQKTTAIRDGEEYVINGQKTFIGCALGVDRLWLLTCTDPKGKRHQNLSYFYIDAHLPGITIMRQDLLGGEPGGGSGDKNDIFFDNVRVPAFDLVGGENEGWKVRATHMEMEHGGSGRISRDAMVDELIDYCKNTQRNGRPMSKDPVVRGLLIDCYVDAEINRLLGLRTWWLAHAKRPRTYEGPQTSYNRKMSGPKIAAAVQRILGPYSQVGATDPQWTVDQGKLEVHQRGSIVAIHPGGTTDVQRIEMSRRMGIGRPLVQKAAEVA
ncbi:MAG: acyl-CoA dehydrogenase family protein [Pseudomonadota bacterium]